jgi:hypothetical protein
LFYSRIAAWRWSKRPSDVTSRSAEEAGHA